MDQNTCAYQIIQEIALIPEHKLREVYDLIHGFRTQLKTAETTDNNIMEFAGAWEDMPDKEFEDFLTEIEIRRQTSNQRRFSDESLFT